MKITYFVHDVGDPAVRRRALSFKAAGACVSVVGPARVGRQAMLPEALVSVINLGSSEDAKITRRAAVLRESVRSLFRHRAQFRDSDLLVARSLEALVVARLSMLLAFKRQALCYECLDIHPVQVSDRLIGKVVRFVEGLLLRSCTTLMVSSPAFVTNYFRRFPTVPRAIVAENRVGYYELDDSQQRALHEVRGQVPAVQDPIVIGWFGLLRCMNSYEILKRLSISAGGRIQVLVAGRPSAAMPDDFLDDIMLQAHFKYVGPFDRAKDLGELYRGCDLAWCVDYSRDASNPDWLLPNRLYESVAFGSVPVGRSDSEIGRWLMSRNIGVVIPDDLDQSLSHLLSILAEPRLLGLKQDLRAVPIEHVVEGSAEARDLLSQCVSG